MHKNRWCIYRESIKYESVLTLPSACTVCLNSHKPSRKRMKRKAKKEKEHKKDILKEKVIKAGSFLLTIHKKHLQHRNHTLTRQLMLCQASPQIERLFYTIVSTYSISHMIHKQQLCRSLFVCVVGSRVYRAHTFVDCRTGSFRLENSIQSSRHLIKREVFLRLHT